MTSGPTIGLLGDVMLGRGVAAQLAGIDPAAVWSDDVRAIAAGCDAAVCNLECCISTRGRPTELIPRKPFFFRAPPAAVDALRAVNVRVAGLANNHVLDYGPEALTDTLDLLAQAGIASAGAGTDEEGARRGVAVAVGGLRLGLAAVSDHPRRYAAGPAAPGIAYAELGDEPPAWLVDEIARLRASCELVVVFCHWGPNMATEPAAWQHALAVSLLDAGADLIAGHSAHVFHGVEHVADGTVLYDLGDALDDYAIDAELRNDLGVLALWRPRGEPALELVGLRLDYCRTELAAGHDADWIARRLERACEPLGTAVERVGAQRFVVAPA